MLTYNQIIPYEGVYYLKKIVLNSLNLCLQEERKQATFEQLLKVANAEREVHETIIVVAISTILDYYRLIYVIIFLLSQMKY